ncbi:MAG: SURF1 family protein [Methylophilus sp.]|uniref:SURF1 family protein n=1 Tax=Methylophilus sp. TaxID=29541 RepID=UPI003FA0D64F
MLVVALLVFGCLKLGMWQLHKAEQKQAITLALADGKLNVVELAAQGKLDEESIEALHTRTVKLTGRYLVEQSFFLDNQVEQGQAGFHVLTPFLLNDQHTVILVNRGWVAGFTDHQQLPVIATNPAEQTVTGMLWHQKKTGFQLSKPDATWSKVQQVIDFEYLQQLPKPLVPHAILKLDPAVAQDGFVRHWDVPAGQVEKHLSYAYQWFGFALASILIGVYQMLEKRQEKD